MLPKTPPSPGTLDGRELRVVPEASFGHGGFGHDLTVYEWSTDQRTTEFDHL